MGYIKEPDNVDFVINGEPWTDKEKNEISEFINKYKSKKKVLLKLNLEFFRSETNWLVETPVPLSAQMLLQMHKANASQHNRCNRG